MTNTSIITNAVDLATRIMELNEAGVQYELKIVKGIDNENLVKLTWKEDEEES